MTDWPTKSFEKLEKRLKRLFVLLKRSRPIPSNIYQNKRTGEKRHAKRGKGEMEDIPQSKLSFTKWIRKKSCLISLPLVTTTTSTNKKSRFRNSNTSSNTGRWENLPTVKKKKKIYYVKVGVEEVLN